MKKKIKVFKSGAYFTAIVIAVYAVLTKDYHLGIIATLVNAVVGLYAIWAD